MRTTDFSKESENNKRFIKKTVFLIFLALYLIFLICILIYWIWIQNLQIKPINTVEIFSTLIVISLVIGMLILFAVSIFYNMNRSLMSRQSCGTQR